MKNYIEVSKDSAKLLIGCLKDYILFTVKYNALNHVVKDVKRHGDQFFLHALKYIYFKLIM